MLMVRVEQMVASHQPAAVGTLPRTTGNETILVVDDNPALLRAASRYLVDPGYRVFTAAHASAALTVLRQEAWIDLLLTDVGMPRRVAATRPDIRILLTSGFHEAWYGDARVNGQLTAGCVSPDGTRKSAGCARRACGPCYRRDPANVGW